MNYEGHFLPPEKLVKLTKKKMDFEVVKNLQSFTEKIITDILNRASLLTRHKNSDIIEAKEISIIVEKDFDYTFGIRTIGNTSKPSSNDHVEKMAELSRQK